MAFLIAYRRHHDEQTIEWLNSAELRETFGLTYHLSIESHREWLESNPDFYIWAIQVDGRHVGNATLKTNARHHKAVLEIYIGDPMARGRGVGASVVEEVLHKAFVELELNQPSGWRHNPGMHLSRCPISGVHFW